MRAALLVAREDENETVFVTVIFRALMCAEEEQLWIRSCATQGDVHTGLSGLNGQNALNLVEKVSSTSEEGGGAQPFECERYYKCK